MAVLSSLYAVKPLPELLSELTQEQQLQAAVLADMWQVPDVSTAVVQAFTAYAESSSGLSEAATQQLLRMPAHPECLQPLLKHVLLFMLGDLEAVWADAALQQQLVKLPLHVTELLLSLDDLTVASEDTVLYTAQQYVNSLPEAQRSHAADQLSLLIRCPHMSVYWLPASVLRDNAPGVLLHKLRPHVQRMLLMRIAEPQFRPTASKLARLLPGAPESWSLGTRQHKLIESVPVTWQLSVSELRDAVNRSAETKRDYRLEAPANAKTPPLGGLAWSLDNQL